MSLVPQIQWLPDEVKKYTQFFDQFGGNRVEGARAVPFFNKSGLPRQTLSLIWRLSDVNHMGSLAKIEFFYACRFVACAQKNVIPSWDAVSQKGFNFIAEFNRKPGTLPEPTEETLAPPPAKEPPKPQQTPQQKPTPQAQEQAALFQAQPVAQTPPQQNQSGLFSLSPQSNKQEPSTFGSFPAAAPSGEKIGPDGLPIRAEDLMEELPRIREQHDEVVKAMVAKTALDVEHKLLNDEISRIQAQIKNDAEMAAQVDREIAQIMTQIEQLKTQVATESAQLREKMNQVRTAYTDAFNAALDEQETKNETEDPFSGITPVAQPSVQPMHQPSAPSIEQQVQPSSQPIEPSIVTPANDTPALQDPQPVDVPVEAAAPPPPPEQPQAQSWDMASLWSDSAVPSAPATAQSKAESVQAIWDNW